MNYKHLDEKKKAQIDVLFKLDYSMREIGRQLHISHSTVSRYLRKKTTDINANIRMYRNDHLKMYKVNI